MTKIVYNACYGGFGLSREGILRYAELKGITLYEDTGAWYRIPVEEYKRINKIAQSLPIGQDRFSESNAAHFSVYDIERTDPALVQVVEELAHFSVYDIERTDPALVQVVEELGKKADGTYAKLRIMDVPAGSLYRIDEYDGLECVCTTDDYDWKVA